MDTPQPGMTPDEILAALRKPLATYRSCLDDGISFADTVMHNLTPCSFTWSTLVRYHTLNRMSTATNDTESAWLLRLLKNNGLEIKLNGWTVRPLKSFNAGPPAPGQTVARQIFYKQGFQQTSLYDLEVPLCNFVLDWDVDDKRHPILALSKPQGLWNFRSVPKVEWRRYVEFPNEGPVKFKPVPDGQDDDINVLPPIDQDEFRGEEAN
jgi:hypothetical protein